MELRRSLDLMPAALAIQKVRQLNGSLVPKILDLTTRRFYCNRGRIARTVASVEFAATWCTARRGEKQRYMGLRRPIYHARCSGSDGTDCWNCNSILPLLDRIRIPDRRCCVQAGYLLFGELACRRSGCVTHSMTTQVVQQQDPAARRANADNMYKIEIGFHSDSSLSLNSVVPILANLPMPLQNMVFVNPFPQSSKT